MFFLIKSRCNYNTSCFSLGTGTVCTVSDSRQLATYSTLVDPAVSRLPKLHQGRSNNLLADSLSRIRNAYFRSFENILVMDSKQIRELLDAFSYAGYIHN